MSSTRPYRMRARGDAVEATRARVLAAVRDLAYEELELDPTLDAVARRAGVSVQTVLRHFGSRDALLEAALEAASREVVAERRPPSGGVHVALRTLLEHYELRGDFVLAMLAREAADPRVAAVVERGRREHRTWVAEVFGDRLPAGREPRAALIDQLVVATDVYAWKLLRRDRHLPVETVRARMRAMTDAIAGPTAATSSPQRGDAP